MKKVNQLFKNLKKIFGIPCQICGKNYADHFDGVGCRKVYICSACKESYEQEMK